jgi:predicted permease
LPGVESASIAGAPLLSGSYIDGLSVEGHPGESAATSICLVSPRFFETMGIALRQGRDFSAVEHTKVAIINETIARQYFDGENPIGRHVGTGRGQDLEIVGVIADTKYRGLREPVPNTLYLPIDYMQDAGDERTLHVRTSAAPGAAAALIREQIRALDRDLPVKLSLFSGLIDDNLAQERLIATLSSFFGGLALLLASIGLYGVMAYTVERRTREIGIRMSLGAQRGSVAWLVLRDCIVTASVGIVVGVPASLWLSRLVRSQLFGVAPGDPATIACSCILLTAVAVLAGYLPARRAARVDPMVALRYE